MENELYLREWIYQVGSNADVDAAAAEDIWVGGGTYTWPAAAAATTIVSGSAADAAAGTGARTVEVIGLTTGMVLARETVTLTGVAAVTLATAFMRVLDVRVRSAGTGQTNAGLLTVAIGGTTAGLVPIGAGRLNAALYSVPADRSAYLSNVTFGAGAVTAGYLTGSLFVRPPGEAWQLLRLVEVSTGAPGRYVVDFDGLLYLAPQTDVRLSVAASVDNMVAYGSLSLMLAAAF